MVERKDHGDAVRRMHDEHAHDEENDRLDTGSFPAVRRKPTRVHRTNRQIQHLVTSALIVVLCMLLGYGYVIQLNNPTSSYETMSEDELTRLITETSTQVQNLQQRKSQLTNQLNSLKAAADKQQEIERIAKQNEDTSGLLSGRLPAEGRGITVTVTQGDRQKVDASTMFQLLEELRNAGVEVMALNNVRVVTSTYIEQDADGTLVCDGVVLKAPYKIKAIGDQQNLQNAVNIAGGVGSVLKVKYGSSVYVAALDKVVIDEIHSSKQYNYAKTVE